MVPAQPLHLAEQGLDGSSFGRDDFGDDEYTDNDVVSLLEENARLRGLLVQLSELIRRNVVHAR